MMHKIHGTQTENYIIYNHILVTNKLTRLQFFNRQHSLTAYKENAENSNAREQRQNDFTLLPRIK